MKQLGESESLAQLDHSRIDYVAFSRDGRWIATAGPNRVHLWEASTGLEVAALDGHEGNIVRPVFLPFDNQVVTAGADHTARVWSYPESREILRLVGHQEGIFRLAVSPNGEYIATGSWDGTAALWAAEDGSRLAILEGSAERVDTGQARKLVFFVEFSPDSKTVYTGDFSRVCAWEAPSGRLMKEYVCSEHGTIVQAALSPDGNRLATAQGSMRGLTVWDSAAAKVVSHVDQSSIWGTSDVRFSSDSTSLVTAEADKRAQVWDIEGGLCRRHVLRHKDEVDRAAFSPDGSLVLTGSWDCSAGVWDASTGRRVASIFGRGPILDLAFSPDGELAVIGSQAGKATVWRTSDLR